MTANGQLSQVLRNVLFLIQGPADKEETKTSRFDFVKWAVSHHFGADLGGIVFDPLRDVEIRAPYRQKNYELDIVSAGSGMNQILQIVAFAAWKAAPILLLDEPDAHLHTSLQSKLFSFLSDLAKKLDMQIIMSTHSRDLISQAPLESIIPVDFERKTLKPIASLEHLLLEYERHGEISNVDIALLYQTKRCLFVEGPSDGKYLPLLAARLGKEVFLGSKQFVIFEFMGADKFTMLGDLATLFERIIGGKLTWMALRDRDYAVPEVYEKYRLQAAEKKIPRFHIWGRHSIENYFLEAGSLLKALQLKLTASGGGAPNAEHVRAGLEEACKLVEDEAQTQCINSTQDAFRKFELSDNPKEHGTKAALKFWKEQCGTLEGKLMFYPGAAVFGKFVELMQNRFGANIRPEDVISTYTAENAPAEIREFFGKLEAL